jgi:hypothetical protein
MLAVLATSWRLLHLAKDEWAYIASERFLLPETDSLVFLVVRADRGPYYLETALSSCSRPFSTRADTYIRPQVGIVESFNERDRKQCAACL